MPSVNTEYVSDIPGDYIYACMCFW